MSCFGLWRKLLQHNINGKIFDVIFNLFSQVKSCVKIGTGSQTSIFVYVMLVLDRVRIRLHCCFSIFLNDMSEFISHAFQELDVLKDCTSQMLSDDDIEVYLKLYLLLYMQMTLQ